MSTAKKGCGASPLQPCGSLDHSDLVNGGCHGIRCDHLCTMNCCMLGSPCRHDWQPPLTAGAIFTAVKSQNLQAKHLRLHCRPVR